MLHFSRSSKHYGRFGNKKTYGEALPYFVFGGKKIVPGKWEATSITHIPIMFL